MSVRSIARPAPRPVSDPSGPPLQVLAHHDGDLTTITLRGELDVATAPRLDRLAVVGDLAVTLGGLSFIDAAGLRALLGLQVRAGGRLELRDVPPRVARLLHVTGVERSLLPA